MKKTLLFNLIFLLVLFIPDSRAEDTLRGHTDWVNSVSFSPDGTLLASGSDDRRVKLWDMGPHPHRLVKISGGYQRGTPGATLPNPLIVEVRDQYGNPLPGAQVTFTVTSGEGKLSGQFTVEQATTDANGHAQRTLTLSPGPGTYTLIEVSAGSELAIFTVGTPDARRREGDYWTWHLPDGAIARLGKGWLSDIAYSHDGTQLVVGSGIGVWVYNALTGAEIDLLTGHTSAVRSVAYNPDGSTLAGGGWDGKLHLWDATTRQHRNMLTGHTSVVNSIAFSRNGMLASGSLGLIHLWDATTGQHLRVLNVLDVFGRAEIVNNIAFSPDGNTLASAGGSFPRGLIRLWDADTGQRRKTIELKPFGSRETRSVAFSPDGSTLAGDGYLWDADTDTVQRLEKAGSYNSVAFSPDGGTLVGGGHNIDLWDAKTGQHQQELKGHAWPVRKVAFSPEGKRFASGGGEEFILWDATGLPLNTVKGHKWLGRSVAFSPDGTLVSGNWAGSIDLWDVDTAQHKQRLTGHASAVRSIAFSPDGRTLASVAGKTIHLWDGVTGQYKMSLPDRFYGGSGSGIGIGIGGIGFGDTSGGLTGIRVGGITIGIGGGGSDPYKYDPFIFSVAFSRDGSMLATGKGSDSFPGGSIDFQDATTGELLNSIDLKADVWSVAFSPDGTLASGSTDGIIRLWDTTSDQPLNTFEGHTSAVVSVAFSSDGKTLASGDAGGIIHLWDVTAGQSMQMLKGHTDDVRSIAFSPDDSRLASGSVDRTIRLWDATTGRPEQTLEGHTSEVWSVAFSRDGSMLASGSLDGSVLLWDMSPYITSQTSATAPTPDFDGDGIVGVPDFLLFVDHFGLTQGDAGYDARYDLDGNGSIGISDFLIFVNSFGT